MRVVSLIIGNVMMIERYFRVKDLQLFLQRELGEEKNI